MYQIGVDVGGMSYKVGIVDDDGNIICKSSFKTINESVENQFEKLANCINEVITNSKIDRKEIAGIGIGCPGSVNTNKGIAIYTTNMNWYNVDVANILSSKTNMKVVVANDADAATLGEMYFGNAKGYNNIILLTFGTGVGGGIVIDKKLYTGTNGVAAELGHISLYVGGLKCGCGRCGCYERYASATALISQTKESMQNNPNSKMWEIAGGNIDNVNGMTSFKAAKLNDSAAIDVVNEYIKYMSEGILNYSNIFRPDAIIIGGGISNEGEYLVDKIKEYLEKYEYGYPKSPKADILLAKLKNDAGIIGAASVVKNYESSSK